MQLDLTDDQELLRATTRALLDAACPLTLVRTLEDDPLGYDPKVWRAGAEVGWTSMLVEPADGGGSVSGSGLVDLAIVAEELGRTLAPGPIVPVNVVALALAGWRDEGRRRAVLDGIMAGQVTAAWVHPARVGEINATDAGPAATGSLELTGEAAPVEAAVGADWLQVSAVGYDGPLQVMVPADAPGVVVTPLGCLDLVRRFAHVRLDRVVVSRDDVVGEPGEATGAVWQRQLQHAVVLQCVETVGALDTIFATTLDYLGDRYSFGRPLASYQALKHRCADIETTLEACRATAGAAVRAVATGAPDAAEQVSIAKAWIAPRATEIVQECVQLHGGIGVTWEHDLHLYLRRVTTNRAMYGTPDDHLDRIAERVLGPAA